MNSFQELQQKHIDLLRRYETNKESADFLKDVRQYIEQVLSASRQIGDSRERNQLRANLRFWGAYIYDNTGTYPNLTLLPSEAGSEPTPAPQPTPKVWTTGRIILAVIGLFCIIAFLFVFPRVRPYSQTPPPIFTPIDSTALFSTPADSMTDIASFATGTAMASGPTPLPVATELPMTGGGGMLGRAFSSTDIQNGTDCSSHRINIQVIHEFAADQPVEPAVLTVSEEGTFRNIVERQIPLNQGRLLEDVRREIDMEIDIPEASGSYLVYIDHPRFTFDSIIIQHLPDCDGNLITIAYNIPTGDYDELQRRPNLGLQIGLMTWGPYPSTDPEPIQEGVAKFHISQNGNGTENIFWISDGSGDFQPIQNDEFIADTLVDYSIGVTSEGQTVSIPFNVYTPYLEYLQNK
jgi:hypothetical protein